jgi:hypothetical protein
MNFNINQCSVNLISPEVAEVIVDESVFAYTRLEENQEVTVIFPGAISHESFNSHADALEEIGRIWQLIREAEIGMQLLFRSKKRECHTVQIASSH